MLASEAGQLGNAQKSGENLLLPADFPEDKLTVATGVRRRVL